MRPAIISIILLLLQACNNGYQTVALKADFNKELNSKIIKGHTYYEEWARTPENIARHLFPPYPHVEGSKTYAIKKQDKSTTKCIITITDEGVFDDEVSGERHTLYFHKQDDTWQLTEIIFEVKRRY